MKNTKQRLQQLKELKLAERKAARKAADSDMLEALEQENTLAQKCTQKPSENSWSFVQRIEQEKEQLNQELLQAYKCSHAVLNQYCSISPLHSTSWVNYTNTGNPNQSQREAGDYTPAKHHTDRATYGGSLGGR